MSEGSPSLKKAEEDMLSVQRTSPKYNKEVQFLEKGSYPNRQKNLIARWTLVKNRLPQVRVGTDVDG